MHIFISLRHFAMSFSPIDFFDIFIISFITDYCFLSLLSRFMPPRRYYTLTPMPLIDILAAAIA